MDDLLLVLAVLPALVLMIYVYRKDRVEREPLGLLLLLCLGGCISVVPTMICELMAESVLLSTFGDTLSFIVADNFLGVALIEEGWKLVFLILIAWSSRHFTHFFDGIVYAVFVSLGFALVENIFYIGGEETIGDAIALAGSRGLLSVPLHAFCGVFMGFFFSRAKAASLKGSHAAFDGARFLTLAVPVLIHGFYDFCLSIDSDLVMTVFFLFVIVVYLYAFRFIRKNSKEDRALPAAPLFPSGKKPRWWKMS